MSPVNLLPTVEQAQAILDGAMPEADAHELIGEMLTAYVANDLKTRAGWLASLDMTLLIDELQDLKSEYFDNAPCCAIDRTGALVDDARRLIGAALGEDTE